MTPLSPEEVNEAVARKIGKGHIRDGWEKVCVIPDYSRSIGAAWEIVEHIQSKRLWCDLSWDCNKWVLNIYNERKKRNRFLVWNEEADTAPMAICLAYLKLE